ncbi:DUF2817 domain-containing protein [Rheinheimera marina]|uniref:DUF2817 domain-containing protein n=2 Tax=Gammaproteobacteria TaxID=1236 RepID=A0ABV9JKX7_9GAMM
MRSARVRHLLPELIRLEALLDRAPAQVSAQCWAEFEFSGIRLPSYLIELGARDPAKPNLLLVGGVHGLERIGSAVLIAFLESLQNRLNWDQTLADSLSQLNLYLLPMVNPVGMALKTRSNGHGVDLMRNGQVRCEGKAAFLVGGHLLSKRLPWYRGNPLQPEAETQALVRLVREKLFRGPFSLVLDCHSGFGVMDRLWFPYAKSREPVPHLAELFRLRQLLFDSYPYQPYQFEPQSQHYLCHGDLWDQLYDESLQTDTTFLPLTLEMGSWNWVRKNPWQLLDLLGMFHPVKPHRVKRVLRTHLTLLHFLISATASQQQWRQSLYPRMHRQQALELWYGR